LKNSLKVFDGHEPTLASCARTVGESGEQLRGLLVGVSFSMGLPQFPYVVEKGSVSVTIYHGVYKGYHSYTVSYYQDGVRKRPVFADFKRAKKEAIFVARRLGSQDADVLELRSADRAAYQRARQLLDPARRAPDDRSGIRPLKRHFADLSAPTPLETAASGLIVFTQDWRVTRKLTEDASVIEHEIIIEVAGEVAPDILQRLNQGLSSDGHPLPRVKVSVNSANESRSKLRFAVKGAHPGLIAYLCERVGLKILGMKRIRVGRVALTDLPAGQWRYLLPHERF